MKTPEIKIEHGIPIPPKRGTVAGGLLGLLRQMKVGDSIKLPLTTHGNYRSIHALAHHANIRITVRRLDKQFFRVWRLK